MRQLVVQIIEPASHQNDEKRGKRNVQKKKNKLVNCDKLMGENV